MFRKLLDCWYLWLLLCLNEWWLMLIRRLWSILITLLRWLWCTCLLIIVTTNKIANFIMLRFRLHSYIMNWYRSANTFINAANTLCFCKIILGFIYIFEFFTKLVATHYIILRLSNWMWDRYICTYTRLAIWLIIPCSKFRCIISRYRWYLLLYLLISSRFRDVLDRNRLMGWLNW